VKWKRSKRISYLKGMLGNKKRLIGEAFLEVCLGYGEKFHLPCDS
jgi:hypothetical protein